MLMFLIFAPDWRSFYFIKIRTNAASAYLNPKSVRHEKIIMADSNDRHPVLDQC
jgi:hypothetical protein